MKKLVLNIISLGMTGFCFAQNSYPDFELHKSTDLGGLVSAYEYLKEVQDDITPNQVRYIEDLVSYWDATQSRKFDGRKSQLFSVTFKSGEGFILTNYDSKGKIISAMERFSNFALPKPVSFVIARQYPNWTVVKSRYSVWYGRNEQTKKTFKVQIRKGDRKKWLKVDSSGGIS